MKIRVEEGLPYIIGLDFLIHAKAIIDLAQLEIYRAGPRL